MVLTLGHSCGDPQVKIAAAHRFSYLRKSSAFPDGLSEKRCARNTEHMWAPCVGISPRCQDDENEVKGMLQRERSSIRRAAERMERRTRNTPYCAEHVWNTDAVW